MQQLQGGRYEPEDRNRARRYIGIRVRDLDRALNFYRLLGFDPLRRAEGDDVAIIRNEDGVELNLVFNANAGEPSANVLMDVPDKYPGYTHMALRVASIPATMAAFRQNRSLRGRH
jgi:lactoylglutathione lyase